MIRSLVASLALLAATSGLAGCAAPSETETGASESAISSSLTQVVDTSAGKVVANAQGLSLYTFDNDVTSESTCYDGCAARWPALLLPAYTAAPAAPFGTTTRRDGSKQITLSGRPLYTFAGDSAEGDINGEGLGGVWHLARPAAE